MSPPDLYEADFHAWSTAQAEALRRLAGLGGNSGIDWENLIEEVESLGRSQRDAVESLWAQALLHLLKLHLAPDDPARRHWEVELIGFLGSARRKYAPSMRRQLEEALPALWTQARRQAARLDLPLTRIPAALPLTLDDLLAAATRDDPTDVLLTRLIP